MWDLVKFILSAIGIIIAGCFVVFVVSRIQMAGWLSAYREFLNQQENKREKEFK